MAGDDPRPHRCKNLSIDANDFDSAPFAQKGGIGKTYRVFGENLNKILDEMNEMLEA